MITWKILNDRLVETSNELEAIESSIYNALTIACGKYDIYSLNYGNQLINILGNASVESKIEQYIKECLLFDDRISEVNDLVYEKNGDEITINFEIVTDFGILTSEVSF
ncbi:MAG: DUF2634 domain-containing protein [Clostridia bacterium]